MTMEIAIVGAGFTGSFLAHALTQKGHKVSVFEKSRGKGGRMSTKRFDGGQFDMGAPVVPAKSEAFVDFMQQLTNDEVAARWNTKVFDCETELKERDEQPLNFVFTPSMSAVCHYFMQGIGFYPGCRIQHMQRLKQGWMLWCEAEQKYGVYDTVIVTAPYPQTHALLSEQFDLSGIPEPQWRACWTVALSEPESNPQSLPALIYSRKGALQTLVHDSAKPGRDSGTSIWVAYLGHALSEQWLEDDHHMIEQRTKALLQQQYPGAFTQIQHCYVHRWRYARLASSETPVDVLRNEDSTLIGAGDWSSGGSVESAWHTANRVLDLLN